jgi:excisionase family DNA binding protein
MVERGELPAVRIRRRILFNEDVLAKWIGQNLQQTGKEKQE